MCDSCLVRRDELDALTWKLLAGQPRYRRAVLVSLKQDPLLAVYRIQVGGSRIVEGSHANIAVDIALCV